MGTKKILTTLCFALLANYSIAQQSQIETCILKAEQNLTNDIPAAIEHAQEALELSLINGDSLLITRSYMLLGRAYTNKGAFDLSFTNYTNAHKYCPAMAYHQKTNINIRIARIYLLIKDFDRAFQYIDDGFNIANARNDSTLLARCHNMRGMTYVNMDENELAEKEFMRALEISILTGDENLKSLIYNNLSIYKSNNPKYKIELLNQAIDYNRSINNDWGVTENHNNLGVQQLYNNEPRKALETLLTASRMAHQLGAKELVTDNQRYLSWVYEELKEYEKAYINLKNMYESEQKIVNQRILVENEIMQLSARLESSEKQRQDETEINNLKIESRNSTIIIIILLSTLVLIILLTIIRRWKARVLKLDEQIIERQQERDLAEFGLKNKKQELVTLSFHIRARINIVGKIKSMLKDSLKQDSQDIKQDLRKVIAFINAQQSKDEQIDILTAEIESISSEFIDKLKTQYPELTRGELQLAAFLRIDMSSKEISLLTGTSEKSINMSRYRLRKHLGLSTDINLQEFLKKII